MNKLLNMIRSVVTRVFLPANRTKVDSGVYPTVNVSYFGSENNPIELLAPYGHHYNPPAESHGISWCVGGIEENQVGMLYRADIRPKGLKPGEVAHGNFLNDTYTTYQNDGTITIASKTGAIAVFDSSGGITLSDSAGNTFEVNNSEAVLTATALTINANTTIAGTLEVSGQITSTGVPVTLTGHTHTVPITGPAGTTPTSTPTPGT